MLFSGLLVSGMVASGAAAKQNPGSLFYSCGKNAPGPVVFSHRAHGSEGAGYECRVCHNVWLRASTVSMEVLKRGEACGNCHNGSTQGPLSRRRASSIQDCSTCHMPSTDIRIRLNRMDAAVFSHTSHFQSGSNKGNTADFSCSDCHPAIFERSVGKSALGMDVPHRSGACAECHNGRKKKKGKSVVFAATTKCLTCHRPQGG
jgi:c(7)-type cytochrome triheme protein